MGRRLVRPRDRASSFATASAVGWPIVHSRIYKAQLRLYFDRFRVIAYRSEEGMAKSDLTEVQALPIPSTTFADNFYRGDGCCRCRGARRFMDYRSGGLVASDHGCECSETASQRLFA